ncbi:FAD binding domain-containing protein [Haloechinothrix salitolerans]|uniref:FAD binding domain-containing protein n=1 Tax=Haloechinothrix salitolerans TaxID=926830 RepID=A0ABW2BV02_9PSEU
MKAAPFAYVRPSSLSDAVAELAATEGEGKVIAGGQSLTPVLAMRLARPETLIDITAVAGLDQIVDADGVVEIGATVRQRRVERDPVCSMVPLLRAAMPWVGHREIRSRGTVCGSVAHADPAAELPAVASCVDAGVVIAGPGGSRSVLAREFFTGAMMTALGQDEIVSAVRFPVAAPGEGFGFAEIARRHGDFALAGVAARVRLDGETVDAVLTGFGISDRPVTRAVSDELITVVRAGGSESGRMADDLREALSTVADEMVDTDGDAHASRDYRRRLFRTLAARELSKAYHRARSDIDEVNE